ncbi:hypothetical protein [Macrococcus capreoli]|uniref:hypothetical protein n=1 Tax=Macrococcus capreoli TaxID=2982690 RepID=UPI0021D5C8AC|nr:hypothetical protein [Macrococcus sp. TMW 2.2395]MCU7556555.1 hypothetical protein [Macrococcus sp. TMW 2.2395]
MSNALPEGFFAIPADKIPQITFDYPYRRFYLSKDFYVTHGLKKGGRVGLAYNRQTRQFIIDKFGNSFYIDKSSYITSARLKEEVARMHGNASDIKSIIYTLNTDLTNNRFIAFDEYNVVRL